MNEPTSTGLGVNCERLASWKFVELLSVLIAYAKSKMSAGQFRAQVEVADQRAAVR